MYFSKMEIAGKNNSNMFLFQYALFFKIIFLVSGAITINSLW